MRSQMAQLPMALSLFLSTATVLFSEAPGFSQELTYHFVGNISEITDNENDVIPDLIIGSTFSGFVTFESSGWNQTIGTVSVTINDIELLFSGQYIYGEVAFAPGIFYDIRVSADNGGDIGNSTFNAFNFGPDLVDTDGSGGITAPFPDELDLSEFEENEFRIWGDYVATGDRIFLTGQLSEFVREKDLILGDVNLDGVVDLLDVAPFVELLQNQQYQFEADINGDGSVNLLDVAPFIDLLQG